MTREWKPGDVVTLDASQHWASLPDGRAAKRVAAFLREIEAMWGSNGDRPLTANNGGTGTLQWLAEAFEAASHDPKPDEPQGLGAVVEDAEGRRHVRTFAGPPGMQAWLGHVRADGGERARRYSEIDAVRILSAGVES